MKWLVIFLFIPVSAITLLESFNNNAEESMKQLADDYWLARQEIFPLEATSNGFAQFNDRLPVDFTDSYFQKQREFYDEFKARLEKINTQKLSGETLYDWLVLEWVLKNERKMLDFRFNQVAPFNQFYLTPLDFQRMGSGKGDQPFRTVRDFENWEKRLAAIPAYLDSSIVYFRKGLAENLVLPKPLVLKMITPIRGVGSQPSEKSLFLDPVNHAPDSILSQSERKRFYQSYLTLIDQKVLPSYRRLADFLSNEYLPQSRESDGLCGMQGGQEFYKNTLVPYFTTTALTPDSIFQIGLTELSKIEQKFELAKKRMGFKGNLAEFYQFLRTDKRFYPFKSEEEILNWYRNNAAGIEPRLLKLFFTTPNCPCDFVAAPKATCETGAHTYNHADAKCSHNAYVTVPCCKPAEYWLPEMMSLLLHEHQPGHHLQNMTSIENDSLTAFRRNAWVVASIEGWGLYSEQLGYEIKAYQDDIQICGALSKDQHRVIRLILDVGIHYKGWSREKAIAFFMEHSARPVADIEMEVERYMAYPGQALGYRIGAMKIQALRKKAEETLGPKFDVRAFHALVLKSGPMPLHLLERRVDEWIIEQI